MSARASAWERLPEELKEFAQWAVAGADKAPQASSSTGKLRNVSVVRPSEWMTFEQARQLAWDNRELVTVHVDREGRTITQTGLDIGYILAESDPFSCIDLDVKDATTHPNKPEVWTTNEDFSRYQNIVTHFDSYTEKSRSGKGIHIWVLGSIGRGYKRSGVEVYSQERFIICTGDVIVMRSVREGGDKLLNMVSQMRPETKGNALEELPAEVDDWHILQTATNASNSEKFWKLWTGAWHDMGFGSQSEADLALMSMFTFYSPSNEQCRRLFRQSALGQREKALKDDRYLNLTLTTIRDRMAREASADASAIIAAGAQLDELNRKAALDAEIARLQGGVPPAQRDEGGFAPVAPRGEKPLHIASTVPPVDIPPPPNATIAQLAPVSAEAVAAGEQGIAWPPGFAGALAHFIYGSAPRPVKEVSIVAALGLLAGLAGKAWHIPQSGLNLYIILIARSAVGKEAMHSGIGLLITECMKTNPFFHNFIDFNEYVSGPALIKACLANQSFVNVSGEWGKRFKRLAAEDGRDGALATLRTQMTNLYQKSGPSSIVGGLGYSSTENNVASVSGVAYSMIGESTPGTFYDALTEGMMEDGFLSRFLTIQYEGDRPLRNKSPITVPDAALVNYLNEMSKVAGQAFAAQASQLVEANPETSALIEAFGLKCDAEINSTDDESRRQMWNRAELKALRIAALLAVADNMMNPVMKEHHWQWAEAVVMRDITVMAKRLDGGDVGVGDNARERKLMNILAQYLQKPIPPSYKVPDTMRQNSIVPRSYMQTRTQQASAFNTHRLGPVKALDDTIANCIAMGYLMEVQKDKVIEAYNYFGKAYRILRVPDYQAQSRK